MRRLLSLIVLLSCTVTWAQESSREADSLRHAYGRQKVSNMVRRAATPYADTLDTGNPGVKVVLYNNGTYRYVKDPSVVVRDSVFTEYWDTRAVNPYRSTPDPIPDKFAIWVVDSLDSYVCPNITHPRSLYGYRLEFPGWGFNIRPSNTEPYLRFICEATSKELLKDKIAQADEIIVKQFGGKR